MAIPLVDLTWQHQQIRPTLDATFERVLSDPICDDMIYAHELEALFARAPMTVCQTQTRNLLCLTSILMFTITL